MNVMTKSPETFVAAMCQTMSDIVQAFVDHPTQVVVEACSRDVEDTVILVTVRPEDINTIIGQQGRMLKALRTYLGAISGKHGSPIKLQIQAIKE